MTKKIPGLVLAAFLLAGCATDPIETAGDLATVPAFRTFKVQEERLIFPEQIPEGQRDRIASELRAAAVGALQGRGYREVTGSEPADVLVVLGAAARTTMTEAVEEDLSKHINPVNTSVFDASSGDTPSDASAPRPPGIGREGDLILYILDPATQRSLWRASSSGAASTPGEALRKARSAYRSMVNKLPMAGG
ncbi:MAG TPA: DUF4136 domain-containing protein [Povalibacter sp.]|uniref:DUF4136 domain-containing protein n=1 Tax=Povalibacter sp. TaxID=1962978 RepID=UPI002D0F7ECA|nr:DUF4136 domain-containing protein [Povalibacter sp.]HMN43989.1 DUF4136 domain-containing protein [Povalibacter sp.]